MNEKIREIAEQAGSTHKQNLGVYQFYSEELEKFAKLIVQDIIENLEFHNHDDAVSQVQWHAASKYGIKV
jgi:hypothetical protein